MANFSKPLLIIIPARKNSLRLKDKNIKKINGKSLVENTILFATKFKKLSNILVSTDSEKIKKISQKYRDVIIHNRTKKFSGPKSQTIILLKKIIKWYEINYKTKLKGIILLQPTTPYRKKNTLSDTIKKFHKENFRYNYISVSSDKLKNNLQIHKNNNLLNFLDRKTNNCYVNGSFYIFNKSKLKNNVKETILNYKTKGVKINTIKYSIDINDYNDLKLAKLYQK
ncbi:hypothetical protein OAD70_07180 [Candidatus Pelagibacter sp.]|nr:hypothetical protein [Candidatus Pelagibacter sp.]|tara:strand:- start:4934 stop:5611 length:678 start_codon:yes stop_codon:yes gene_type:complete